MSLLVRHGAQRSFEETHAHEADTVNILMIPAIFFYAARIDALRRIMWAVWVGLGLNPHAADADTIALVSAQAILEMPEAAVFGPERTAAAMAIFSAEESTNKLDAVSYWDYPAYGAWQQIGGAGKGSARTQARGWLRLLQQGAIICPRFPMAPLCGGCERAWHMANRRTHTAWQLSGLE